MLDAGTFLSVHSPKLEGWLYPGAVELSEILLSAADSAGVRGGGLEIGVYKAKYLSYLANAAPQRPWLGLDVFIFGQKPDAERALKAVSSQARQSPDFALEQVNTQDLDTTAFRQLLSKHKIEELAFASVDGDHSAEGVKHDLGLVESALAPGGIVAMDDMFSAMSACVSEGFFDYMRGNTKLRPIAFSDNKLFLTTRGYDELYQIKIFIALGSHKGMIASRWREGSAPVDKVRPFLGGRLLLL